jgi:hypothetical protein
MFVLLKVGKLQSWYREEKKPPKPPKEGKGKGIFKRGSKRKNKSKVSKKGAKETKTPSEKPPKGTELFKKGDVAEGELPPPPPPSEGKASMVDLINEIEIAEANPPPEPDSSVTFHKAQPSLPEQVEVAEVKDSTVQKDKDLSKVSGKKKIKMKKMKIAKRKP